jgi:energy-coupling factor transport system ATP-binding protein
MPITLEQVSFTYQPGTPYEWHALQEVSLTIPDGQFWGIIGATGSGKSTLIQHFNALLQPTSGRVLVDGADLAKLKGMELKRHRQKVGMLFQYAEQQLFGETIREDVGYGPRNLGLSDDVIELRVRRAIRQVGLDESFLERSPFTLSGGQARRVALAGVLAMEPRVLVLDEPTSGLDPQGRREILDLVRTYPSQGMTVILVSHSMDDVAALADQVAVLHRGRVWAQGAPRDLFARRSELEGLGLGVPAASRLLDMLREKGWPVSVRAVTVEEAVAQVRGVLKGGRKR